MSRVYRIGAAGSLAAMMLSALACGRTPPTSPSSSRSSAPLTSAGGATAAVGDSTDATAVAGQLKVCKAGNAPGTFTVTTSGAPVASPVNVAVGQCIVVAENPLPGDLLNVTVTETSAGLASVTAEQNGGATVPFSNGGTLGINQFHGYTVTFTNNVPPDHPPSGTQGCSPGYFKNHENAPTGFNRQQTLNAVLDTNVFPANLTIGAALSLKGGGVNALARHAAAALLNAAALPQTYTYTLTQLRTIFDQIEAGTLSIDGASSLLESAEDIGSIVCPLN